MKFTFQKDGKQFDIETAVRINDAAGKTQVIQTSSILGSRFVTDAFNDGDNQKVILSEKPGMFSRSLLTEDGKSIRVVIDRSRGIVNPYLTINNWSMRQSTSENGTITITSLKCPFDVDSLPDTIPLNDPLATMAGSTTASTATASSSGNRDTLITAAAAIAGAYLATRSSEDDRDISPRGLNVGTSSRRTERDSLVSFLRS